VNITKNHKMSIKHRVFITFCMMVLPFLVGCQGVRENTKTALPPTEAVALTAQTTNTTTPTSTISPTETPVMPAPTQTDWFAEKPAASCTGQQKKVLIIERFGKNSGFLYVENEGKLQFLDEGMLPAAFSPYGEKLLVVNNTTREIGIADWNGKNLWMIPQPEYGRACKGAWLTEDELLVSVCTNVRRPSYDDDRTYIYDLNSREYRKVGQDVILRIQAISPRGDLWFAVGDQLYLERKDGTELPVD